MTDLFPGIGLEWEVVTPTMQAHWDEAARRAEARDYPYGEYTYAVAAARLIARNRKKYAVSGILIWESNHELVCEQPEYGSCGHKRWTRMRMKLNGVGVKYLWAPGLKVWKRVW